MTGQELYEALGKLSPKDRERPAKFLDECGWFSRYREVTTTQMDRDDRLPGSPEIIALWNDD